MKLDIIIACIGVWLFADGVASLWTYTGQRSDGQTWLRDHSLRLFRSLLGLYLVYVGYTLL